LLYINLDLVEEVGDGKLLKTFTMLKL